MRKRTKKKKEKENNVVVLAGGTGSVKLVRGLASLPNVSATVICNVADNIWLHGLYVCPDIDTIIYGLSNTLDTVRGWGVSEDTFHCLEWLRRLGVESWFKLGDKDLAMHIARTEMLGSGMTLTKITDHMRMAQSITAKILPSTDDPVETTITTVQKGPMHLQEFWVKHRGRLSVRAVEYQGAKSARATREVVEAILDADRIFISPGNPVSSIGPIISIDGIHTLLSRRKDIVVAVSPLIGPRAISGPAVKYMKARGIKATAEGVANFYSDVAGTIAISNKDAKLAASIEQAGMKVIQTDILMRNKKDEIRLANTLLDQGYKSQ